MEVKEEVSNAHQLISSCDGRAFPELALIPYLYLAVARGKAGSVVVVDKGKFKRARFCLLGTSDVGTDGTPHPAVTHRSRSRPVVSVGLKRKKGRARSVDETGTKHCTEGM